MLREKHKSSDKPDLIPKVGDVVFIRRDADGLGEWQIARIVELQPDKEGAIRKAVVETTRLALDKNGKEIIIRSEILRPINFLYPLENPSLPINALIPKQQLEILHNELYGTAPSAPIDLNNKNFKSKPPSIKVPVKTRENFLRRSKRLTNKPLRLGKFAEKEDLDKALNSKILVQFMMSKKTGHHMTLWQVMDTKLRK